MCGLGVGNTDDCEDPLPTIEASEAFHLTQAPGEDIGEARGEQREKVKSGEALLDLEADVPATQQVHASRVVARLGAMSVQMTMSLRNMAVYLKNTEQNTATKGLGPVCREAHCDGHAAPDDNQRREPERRPEFADYDVRWEVISMRLLLLLQASRGWCTWELKNDVWDEEDHRQDGVPIPNVQSQVIPHTCNSGLKHKSISSSAWSPTSVTSPVQLKCSTYIRQIDTIDQSKRINDGQHRQEAQVNLAD